MTWHNDRRAAELLIWPVIIEAFVDSQAESQETDDERASCARIVAACRSFSSAVFDSVEAGRRGKIDARARRAARDASAKTLEGKHGGTVGTAIYYALEELLSAGTLELDESSPLAAAMGEVISCLTAHFANAKVDAAGRKSGRRFLDHLISQGHFTGHRARMSAHDTASELS